MAIKSACVFCGSSPGAKPAYDEAARQVGKLLAEQKITLVYGGGNIGLMGALADAAMEAGGTVIGVIPQSLADREVAHLDITRLDVVTSMHERKAKMEQLSDAFIALPGGYGTLEEFCEIITWCQLGLHHKPCGILNVEGFYDALLSQFDHAVGESFIRPEHRELFFSASDSVELLDRLQSFKAPKLNQWIGQSET